MPGPVRSLLPRIQVKTAGRLSRCHHDKRHEIRKGEVRVVVKNPGPASGEAGYCVACAIDMLCFVRQQITELEASLDGSHGDLDLTE